MFRIVSLVAIFGTLAAIAGHYVVFGPRHRDLRKEPKTVRRFNVWERCVHAATLLSFGTLAVTGFAAVWMGSALGGWLRLIHWIAGPVFSVGLSGVVLTWAQDGCFERYDWQWALHLGGYLGGRQDLPAGRFNGGQKAYLWFIGLAGLLVLLSGLGRMFPLLGDDYQWICYEVHRYGSLLLVLGVISHAYLGTLANPATWQAMLTGRVSVNWGKHHHPQWWETLNTGGQQEHEK